MPEPDDVVDSIARKDVSLEKYAENRGIPDRPRRERKQKEDTMLLEVDNRLLRGSCESAN